MHFVYFNWAFDVVLFVRLIGNSGHRLLVSRLEVFDIKHLFLDVSNARKYIYDRKYFLELVVIKKKKKPIIRFY